MIPAERGVEAVSLRPNGHRLDYKPLLRFVGGVDVGLIPCWIVDSMRSGYPLKLHEHLSAGLHSWEKRHVEVEGHLDGVLSGESAVGPRGPHFGSEPP